MNSTSNVANSTSETVSSPDVINSTICPNCIITEQTNSTVPTCTDSDGGANYYTYGKITYTNSPEGIFEEYDICSSNSVLTERICVDPSNHSKNFVNYNCPNGCLNGFCLSSPLNQTANQTDINNERLELLNSCQFEAQPENANSTWYIDIGPNNVYYNIILGEGKTIPNSGTYDFHPSFANYCSLSEGQQTLYASKLLNLSEKYYRLNNFDPIIAFIIWGWDYTPVGNGSSVFQIGSCKTNADCALSGVCVSGHCLVYSQNNKTDQTNQTNSIVWLMH